MEFNDNYNYTVRDAATGKVEQMRVVVYQRKKNDLLYFRFVGIYGANFCVPSKGFPKVDSLDGSKTITFDFIPPPKKNQVSAKRVRGRKVKRWS